MCVCLSLSLYIYIYIHTCNKSVPCVQARGYTPRAGSPSKQRQADKTK